MADIHEEYSQGSGSDIADADSDDYNIDFKKKRGSSKNSDIIGNMNKKPKKEPSLGKIETPSKVKLKTPLKAATEVEVDDDSVSDGGESNNSSEDE